MTNIAFQDRQKILTRASNYLATIPGSIEGSDGSGNCFKAALSLVKGFSLSDSEAMDLLLNEFNLRCVPEWSASELEHKIKSARLSDKENGYLLKKSIKADGPRDIASELNLTRFLEVQSLQFVKAKPGISFDGLKRLSVQSGTKKGKPAICFPVYCSLAGTKSKPVNYISIPRDGTRFEWTNKDAKSRSEKVLTQYGGKNGIVGSVEHVDRLLSANLTGYQILITAGPTDLAALHSLGLPEKVIAVTQAFGEGGMPSHKDDTVHIVDLLAMTGCDILVAYDTDDKGRKSSAKLGSHLAGRGCSVKVIDLARLGKQGKDIRDFIVAGATVSEILSLADDTPVAIAEPEDNPKPATIFGTSDESSLTDLANATRFIDQFHSELLFVPEWGKVLSWDGSRWADDSGVGVKQRAQRYAKSLWKELAKAGSSVDESRYSKVCSFVRASNQGNKIDAFLKLAQYDERIVCPVADLNSEVNLLNVVNGTIDLDTGTLRPHNPADRITQIASVAYDPAAACPRWDETLNIVFDGDNELIRYVQQVLGYAISGDTGEHLLPIGYGNGNNGKSTIWSVVVELLGDYGSLSSESLLLGDTKNHPTEIAQLYRKRFVAISEPEKGAKLREARVKELTGERKITARRMHEDFWTFERTHTFWLSTNHKPRISGTDQGIWRRIKLIPFRVDISTKVKKIPDFDKWLVSHEGPGIMRWLVEGFRDYKQNGFVEPLSVQDATMSYAKDSDVIGRFLTEHTIEGADFFVSAKSLFEFYRDQFGGKMTQTSFGTALAAKGLQKTRVLIGGGKKQTIYQGIDLRDSENTEKQALDTDRHSTSVSSHTSIENIGATESVCLSVSKGEEVVF